MSNKLTKLTTYILLPILFFLMVIFVPASDFLAAKEEFVLKIGDLEVNRALYYYVTYQHVQGTMNEIHDVDYDYMYNGQTLEEYFKSLADETFQKYAAVIQIASELGMKLDERDFELIAKERSDSIALLGGEENYYEYLQSFRSNDLAYYDYLTLNRLSNKLTEEYYKFVTLTGKEISEAHIYFNKNFLTTKTLVKYFYDFDENLYFTDEEELDVNRTALELLIRIKKGEDFIKMIDEYSDDRNLKSGNYTFDKLDTSVDRAYQDAVKPLVIGDYTKELVKTKYGYNIIFRYPLDQDYFPEFLNVVKGNEFYTKASETVSTLKTEINTYAYKKIKLAKNS